MCLVLYTFHSDLFLCGSFRTSFAFSLHENLCFLMQPETVTKVFCPLWPANSKGMESFSCSIFNYCNMGMRSYNVAEAREVRTNQLLDLRCKNMGVRRNLTKMFFGMQSRNISRILFHVDMIGLMNTQWKVGLFLVMKF